MIYFLDGNQEVIKIVRSSAVISAIQTQELPEDNSLLRDYLSVRLKNDERLFNAQYMAIKSYGGNRNAFDLYRIASEIVPDNATEFMGVQVAPYELEGVVIEDLRPQNRPLNQTMNQVLEGSDWQLGYVADNLPNITTNFYYTSVKDALKKIQELANVEMLFKVEISGNKITDKWVEVYHQLGNRTMKRFNYGTNALSVVRESSHDELYTALIGRGKGEEVGDGHGRAVTFENVVWSIANDDPIDKPKGQKYIELPNATAEYGIKLIDGRKVPRIGIVEFSDTDDPNVLINQTYQELMVRARPKVLFKASVINTGDMLIGDTVTIHRHDLDFHYQARVRKVVRNRKNNNKTQVEIGDVVHTPSTKRQGQINSALNNVASDLEDVRGEITEARRSADGKNTNFYGNVEPDRKKVGDTWFRDHPSLTGESQILVWNGEAWELIMDTSETAKNAENILEAKGIAETARDNALDIATDLQEGTSFYKHTQDIGLASKNSDGTINSIINLGSDGTAYVGGENIVLDGNTIVDGTFTITDKMIAPNAEIDGAKIQDATIGSAKIADLDANKVTTGRLEGIEIIAESGKIADWVINDTSLSAKIGDHYTVINSANDVSGVAIATHAPARDSTKRAKLQIRHDGTLRFTNGVDLIAKFSDLNSQFRLETKHDFRVYPEKYMQIQGSILPINHQQFSLGSSSRQWKEIHVMGGGIKESSDRRQKTKATQIPDDILNKIALEVDYKMYEMGGETHFGYIAQDVEQALFNYVTEKQKDCEEANELIEGFAMLSKDEDKYSLSYSQVEVLKGAYRDKKIEKLENRIEVLENERTSS